MPTPEPVSYTHLDVYKRQAPDRSLARPVTKVGIVGAGLMASQLALLFIQRLEVPVVMTDLDQERVDKGVAYVHGQLAGRRKKEMCIRDRPGGKPGV